MILWFVFGVLTLCVVWVLVRPLLARQAATGSRGDYDLAVYRRQLSELEVDVARGVVTAQEEAAAGTEIKRRMLRAAEDQDPSPLGAPRWGWTTAVVAAIAVPVAAAAIYGWLGSPNLPDQPLSARATGGPAPQTAQAPTADGTREPADAAPVEDMVASLAERLAADPANAEGWRLLGRSYAVMGRYDDAIRAYLKARELPGGDRDPGLLMALAETTVFAADGTVTERAEKRFGDLLAVSPGHPGARFYLALARGQAGDRQGMYKDWLALARESEPDAPWLPALRERLQETAQELGRNLDDDLPPALVQATQAPPTAPAAAPGPSAEQVQAAQSMSDEDRTTMIRTMVARLAERLQGEPADFDGWLRLGRAYRVLKEFPKARDAYARAAALRPGDLEAQRLHAGSILDAEGSTPVPMAAVAALKRVLALDPNNTDALWFLGQADAEQGRTEAAIEKWRKLLAALPADSPNLERVRRRIKALQDG